MLELSFLGSGNAFAPDGRYWSSLLLNGRYLLDAPPTLLPHLKRLGVSPTDICTIFISHFHGDHFLGLPFLLLEYLHMTPRQENLYIVGPPGVEKVIEAAAELAFPNLSNSDAGYQRCYLEAEAGRQQTVNDLSFQAFSMKHANAELAAFGYRLSLADKVVAYSGDTELCDELFDLAEGADVLVLDCNYSESRGLYHVSFADVPVIRKRLPPSTTIILTHLEAEPDVSGLEGVLVARDFETFRFP
ncbi:MAG: MBL fold metallo-hydrolase [Dehalococcoidia bacterium]|nr:MAG: MBL fold metallo-hydrolase [Dehalococcoidia bacterium]